MSDRDPQIPRTDVDANSISEEFYGTSDERYRHGLALIDEGLAREYESVATKPVMSDNPDELEVWESAMIKNRSQPFPHEEDKGYAIRRLYEETFSVNQSPGRSDPPRRKGMPGLTPGGLVSHFYGGANLERLGELMQKYSFVDTPLEGAIVEIVNRNDAEDLLSHVQDLSTMDLFAMSPERHHPGRLSAIIKESGVIGRLERLESVGYRMIQMFQATPEMVEPANSELAKLFGFSGDQPVPRALLMRNAWQEISPVLLPDGYYTHDDTAEVRGATAMLLTLRTHPDMQAYYEHYSPSGYINQAKTQNKPA